MGSEKNLVAILYSKKIKFEKIGPMEAEELFSEAAELEDMVKEIESDITMKQYLGKLVSNNIFKGTTMIRREKIKIFFGTLVFPILETIKNPEDLESLVRHYIKNI